MSLSSLVNKNTYTGNDSVSVYAYSFKVFLDDDFVITVLDDSSPGVESTLVKTTDYTVSGVGETAGGNITLVNASQSWLTAGGNLKTGYVITIRRKVDLKQETDVRNQGTYFPEIHEDQMDKHSMTDQQQQDEIDRTVKLPESVLVSDFDPELPTDIGTADKVLIVNSAGDGLEMGPTASDISGANASAVAAAASAGAASTSETNAAASAAAAATAAAASNWSDVSYKTFGDSPVTVITGDSGVLYSVDCTGGNVVLNLPSIAALDLSAAWSVGVKKSDSSANTITVNRDGTDVIDGGTTYLITKENAGATFIPDTDASPDEWTSLNHSEWPVTGDVVGTTDSQILENKTFDDEILMQEIATPSTPALGYKAIYPKADGLMYTLNDAGEEVAIGTGSGSGGINYIENPDGEVNSTGVTVSSNITLAAETTNPIRGTQSFKFTIDTAAIAYPTASYDYIEFDLKDIDGAGQNIDEMDMGKSNHVSFDYRTDSNYTAEDLQVVVRNTDGANDELVTGGVGSGKVGSTGGNNGRFTGVVYYNNTDNSYKLRLNVLAAPASDSVVVIDNITLGPDKLVDSPIIGEWEDYTPTTQGLGTVTGVSFFSKREGDTLKISGKLTTGTVTATEARINIGYNGGDGNVTIDSVSNPSIRARGTVAAAATTATAVKVALAEPSVAYLTFGFNNATTPELTKQNGNAMFASSTTYSFDAEIPITEFVGQSAVQSTTELMNETVKVSGAGNGGTAVTAAVTDIPFTEVKDDLGAWSGSVFTAPETGRYSFGGAIYFTTTASRAVAIYKNGTLAQRVGDYLSEAVHYFNGEIDLLKDDQISVRSVTGGGTLSNNTTLHHISISGHPNLSVYSVYGNYEVLSATSSEKTPTGSNTNLQMTGNSLTLTPGTWELKPSMVTFFSAGTVGYTRILASWYGANGADTGATPAALSTVTGLTVLTAANTNDGMADESPPTNDNSTIATSSVFIRCTQECTVYLVPWVTIATTVSNARVTANPVAERKQ